MAWPCISRVCCLARFWSQLDKSDLSVPLTIHSYSDIEEPEEGASPARGGPRRGAAADGRSRAGGGQLPAGPPPSQDNLAIKRSWKRGSHKRGPAAPPDSQPFAAETQYRQDFRAWPLQKRDAYPWAGEGRRDGPPAPPRSVYVLPAGDSDQRPEASSRLSCSPPGAANTTSYRIPASFSALEGPVLRMHQGCVVKWTVVCRTSSHLLQQLERYTLSEAGDFRKRKEGLIVKAVE
ncbi:MAP6 domain-containing protein 1 isoform X2 [Chrysemys picta bellii]|uniref:MAP6 domain-containing protein 1 isoform X2 n=1 Tax=Chrysemys picta bellii TaxID=8478 RepID=UPI0032B1C504